MFEAVEGLIPRDDESDPHRRFLRQVLGAAAELERGLIRARLRGGRRRKQARGGYIGGSRFHGGKYGFELVDGRYEPVAEQQQVLGRIRDLRAQGATFRAIAAELTLDGVAPPSGQAWYAGTVRLLALREAGDIGSSEASVA